MIAMTVGYDLVFVLHLIFAVATLVVFIAMGLSASALAKGASLDSLTTKFPQRNWAARVIHLVAVTGIIMAITGGHDVSFARPWVGFGLLMYLLAAGHLEARVLPLERTIGARVRDASATAADGKKLATSVNTLLVLIALALLAMITQF